MPDIELEQAYATDPATLWLAVSDRRALSAWLMPTSDFAPQVGATVAFRSTPRLGFDGVVEGEVVAAEAPSRLAFTWRGAGVDTLVEFTVLPDGDGRARLQLRQTGFEGLRARIIARVLRGTWRHRLATRLRATTELLARHEPAALDAETVAAAAGDRDHDLDVHGLLRRWTLR